jgi:hypothetical protein
VRPPYARGRAAPIVALLLLLAPASAGAERLPVPLAKATLRPDTRATQLALLERFASQRDLLQTLVDRGRVRHSWTTPDGSRITVRHGKRLSWVRIDHGDHRSVMLLNHGGGNRQNLVNTPGALTTFTREVHDSTIRRSTVTTAPDGRYRRQTQTHYGLDQAAELHELSVDLDAMHERLVRYDPITDTLDRTRQRLDAAGLWHGVSEGPKNIRWKRASDLESKAAKHAMQQYLELEHQRGRLRFEQYDDGSWTMTKLDPQDQRGRQPNPEHPPSGALGVIAVEGRKGELLNLSSGFVSALGTPFGRVVHRQRGARLAPEGEPRAIEQDGRPRVLRPLLPPTTQWDVAAEQRALDKVVALYQQLTGRRIVALPDSSINGGVFIPADGGPVRVNPALIRRGWVCLLAILAHEVEHQQRGRQHDPRRIALGVQQQNMMLLGRRLEADVAQLQFADLGRIFEREADTHAAQVLDLAERAIGGVSLQGIEAFLTQHERLEPWLPFDVHDPARERIELYRRLVTAAHPHQ